MHRGAVICLPLVLLALSACRDDGGAAAPSASPSSAATSPAPGATATPTTDSSAPSPAPTKSHHASASRTARTPAPAGPGKTCGTVQPPGNGPAAVIGVLKGHVDCAAAVTVFRTYYRRDTPKQGSAGVATVHGWRCASNSAAQANLTGRMSTCRTSTITIAADIIP
ncbi:hypothetical protein [Actinoallomurus soli]|uniref:hypothetical protein n=1 Tax=Actinoallomurus soli TaxID=2952535 RepID=UPI00209202FA|nr:hypothetical protein [Actinoallomurus soli]MCO5968908.1 hypothetical protein [Actinoallomurus soli]